MNGVGPSSMRNTCRTLAHMQRARAQMVSHSPDSGSLAEVLDRVLDKGIVVDAWARVALVGIEILTIEARVVIASVDTFLHSPKKSQRLSKPQ